MNAGKNEEFWKGADNFFPSIGQVVDFMRSRMEEIRRKDPALFTQQTGHAAEMLLMNVAYYRRAIELLSRSVLADAVPTDFRESDMIPAREMYISGVEVETAYPLDDGVKLYFSGENARALIDQVRKYGIQRQYHLRYLNGDIEGIAWFWGGNVENWAKDEKDHGRFWIFAGIWKGNS